jgi:uncharacterized membrane protein YgdD (TMEM256/DUF423 family)
MTTTQRIQLTAAAITLLLATLFGAFGTHGLRGSLNPAAWETYTTAVEYQFYHGLGLLGTAIVAGRFPDSGFIGAAGWLLLAGILLFCGSLYLLAFGAPSLLGAVAPIGGTAFMLGWLALAIGVLRESS